MQIALIDVEILLFGNIFFLTKKYDQCSSLKKPDLDIKKKMFLNKRLEHRAGLAPKKNYCSFKTWFITVIIIWQPSRISFVEIVSGGVMRTALGSKSNQNKISPWS